MAMKKVLFVCVHNSGRSQMAQAFFNQLTKGRAKAVSAGTKPAVRLNAMVVAAMREAGLDISHQRPKLLKLEMLQSASRVITMGCNVAAVCPASFMPTEDWELDDPEGKPLEDVREIRDVIRKRVEALVKALT